MEDLEQFLDVRALVTRLVEYSPRLLAAAIILVVFWTGFRIVRRFLLVALARMEMHASLKDLLVDKLFRYLVTLVAVVMAADQLGFNVGTALAGVGVVGIALGFAAQDSVANVISGILIFWDKPFEVGDWIETENAYGRVADITLRSTRIRTPRNTFVIVPNKRIIDATLENYTKQGAMRVDVPVGIAYKEDVRTARAVLLEMLAGLDGLNTDIEPDIVVTELGGSSVNLLVRVWVDGGELRQPIFYQVLESSKAALDRAGIQIPYPHLQLFVDDVQERVWQGLASLSRGLPEKSQG